MKNVKYAFFKKSFLLKIKGKRSILIKSDKKGVAFLKIRDYNELRNKILGGNL